MGYKISNLIKILCPVSACVLMSVACTGNFEELNTHPTDLDPDQMSSTERVGTLLPTLTYLLAPQQENQSQMIDQIIFGQLGGYYSCGNTWEGVNIATYNPSDKYVAPPFNDILPTFYSNYFNIKEVTGGEGNVFLLANVLRAGIMLRAADTYGPIPYSKIDGGAFEVPYDSLEDLYPEMINDLSDAIRTLEGMRETVSSDLAQYDILFGGDFGKWLQFANSLKFRMAVRMSSMDVDFAKTAMQEAMTSGMLLDNADNASLPTSDNPIFKATDDWTDMAVSSTITTYMNGYNDPRMPFYFTESTQEGKKYHGHPLGRSDGKLAKGTYSLPKLTASSPLLVFNAAESYFLMAEAALKGWISGGDSAAKDYYETGIRKSMEQWGAAIGDYLSVQAPGQVTYQDPLTSVNGNLTLPAVSWDAYSNENDHLWQILTQKYIANFMIGLESWCDFRRTGYPVMFASVRDMGNIGSRQMRRLPYPESERANNTANYQQAVAENFGGRDVATVDLAWAKKD